MDPKRPEKTEAGKLNDAFVVHRCLKIPSMRDKNSRQIIQACLAELKGVLATDVNNRMRLTITYDATQVDFGRIEKVLRDVGYPTGNDWWSRFKSGWYRYLDENAQSNATSKGGACCSNPGDVYANRRK